MKKVLRDNLIEEFVIYKWENYHSHTSLFFFGMKNDFNSHSKPLKRD